MKLCKDCAARNQCGNDNVTFCAGYVKEVPTKWVTVPTIEEQIAEKVDKLFSDAVVYEETSEYLYGVTQGKMEVYDEWLKWLKEKHE